MTMWLNSGIVTPVFPVTGKTGWFKIDGISKILGYENIGEWLCDEVPDQDAIFAKKGSGGIVKNAKLVGIHDNEELMRDDPRFNHLANTAGDDPEFSNEPEFVIVKQCKGPVRPSDLYLCGLMVNVPESLFYEYIAKTVYGEAYEWQGLYNEWKRRDPAEIKKEEAQEKIAEKKYQAHLAAMLKQKAETKLKKPVTKKAAANTAKK